MCAAVFLAAASPVLPDEALCVDLHFSFDVSRAAALSYAFYGKQVPALLCCKELSLAEGPRGSRCDVLGRTLKNDHRHYVFPPGADSVPGFVLPLKGIWCFFQIPFFLSNFFFFFFSGEGLESYQ